MAWLNTAPEVEHTGKGPKPEPVTRLKKLQDEGAVPLLPHNPAPYLTDWLFEIGPSIASGMGESPIGFRDLAAWQEIMGAELLPWEARVLIRLSDSWLAERQRARKADALAPYTGEIDDQPVVRNRVAEQFKAMARGRLAKPED